MTDPDVLSGFASDSTDDTLVEAAINRTVIPDRTEPAVVASPTNRLEAMLDASVGAAIVFQEVEKEDDTGCSYIERTYPDGTKIAGRYFSAAIEIR